MGECFKPNVSRPYFFMPVLSASKIVFAVIQMNRFQILHPDNSVKLFQYGVKIISNIIAGIKYMTGIQADSQFLGTGDTV